MRKINSLFLIDDDSIFQFLAQKELERTQLVKQIKMFSSGIDAIDFLEEIKNNAELLPEIILLDLNMPVMDGWEFLEEFAKLQPQFAKGITLYIVSSSISPIDIEKANTINLVADYLIKPISGERFMSIIGGV